MITSDLSSYPHSMQYPGARGTRLPQLQQIICRVTSSSCNKRLDNLLLGHWRGHTYYIGFADVYTVNTVGITQMLRMGLSD